MSSTLTINFSLRQNKAIERSIAFECLQRASPHIGTNALYVGLGSLWFQDFLMAHRLLGIHDMISIEGDEAVSKRAEFNKPLRTISVRSGWTSQVIPVLLDDDELRDRPWIAWLDYDRELDRERLEELVHLVQRLPAGSSLLTTFNAKPGNYGAETSERRSAVVDLFGGDIVDPDLPDESFDGARLMQTLADCLQDYLLSQSVRSGRDERYIPAIELMYRDSTYMLTVGGFLPASESREALAAIIDDDSWAGRESAVIETLPLTIREIQALIQLLPPHADPIKAADVAALGFELPEQQIEFFSKHYLRYPTYAEIV